MFFSGQCSEGEKVEATGPLEAWAPELSHHLYQILLLRVIRKASPAQESGDVDILQNHIWKVIKCGS